MCIDEAATAYLAQSRRWLLYARPSARSRSRAQCCGPADRLRDLKQSQRRRARAKRSAGGASDSWCGENGGTSTDTRSSRSSLPGCADSTVTSQSVAVVASVLMCLHRRLRRELPLGARKASREGRRAQVECARHRRGALLPSHRRSGHLLASHRLRTSSRVRDGESCLKAVLCSTLCGMHVLLLAEACAHRSC